MSRFCVDFDLAPRPRHERAAPRGVPLRREKALERARWVRTSLGPWGRRARVRSIVSVSSQRRRRRVSCGKRRRVARGGAREGAGECEHAHGYASRRDMARARWCGARRLVDSDARERRRRDKKYYTYTERRLVRDAPKFTETPIHRSSSSSSSSKCAGSSLARPRTAPTSSAPPTTHRDRNSTENSAKTRTTTSTQSKHAQSPCCAADFAP